MSDIENGSLGSGYKPTDFMLSEGDTDRLQTLEKQDSKRFYYDQSANAWSKKSCTIFSAIGALSDLYNYEFTESEIKEIDNYSYSTNEYNKNAARNKNSGWYDGFAVALVANWRNSQKNKTDKYGKVVYYSVDMDNDALINSVLDKNYNICSGYYGNSKYNADRDDNLVLDDTTWGTTTYGHALNYIKVGGSIYCKDNYKSRKSNIYKIANPLSKITTIHNMGYVFVGSKVDNTEEIKRLNEIKTLCNNIITDLGTLYNKVNDSNFQGILHYTAEKLRSKVKDADNELKKY